MGNHANFKLWQGMKGVRENAECLSPYRASGCVGVPGGAWGVCEEWVQEWAFSCLFMLLHSSADRVNVLVEDSW